MENMESKSNNNPVEGKKDVFNIDWDKLENTKVGEREVRTGKEFADAQGGLAKQVEEEETALEKTREHIKSINKAAHKESGMSDAEKAKLKEMQETMAKNTERQDSQAEEQSLSKKSLVGRIKGWFS